MSIHVPTFVHTVHLLLDGDGDMIHFSQKNHILMTEGNFSR